MKKRKQEVKTNLEVLDKSDERPKVGDVFVFKPRGRDYYFGLVVNPDIKTVDYAGKASDSDDWDGALVYVYNQHAADKEAIPELDLNKLLLPPLILDLTCWRLGYVKTVGSVMVTDNRVLSQHCFLRVMLVPERREKYVDEHGRPLPRRSEPCGTYGLVPYRGFDDEISRALGIPPAPD